MTARLQLARVAMFAIVVTLSTMAPARAEVSCHTINAKGVGEDLGNFATRADIIGGGLLHGTTAAQFAPTGMSGTVLSFAGTVTFTTNHGTLTVAVTGTVDVATGEFQASGPVSAATGKLEGATGTITLHGIQDLATGSFVEDVSGNICVDLSRGGA